MFVVVLPTAVIVSGSFYRHRKTKSQDGTSLAYIEHRETRSPTFELH